MSPAAMRGVDLIPIALHVIGMTTEAHTQSARPDAWLCARRGLRLRCPACGQGKLLTGYLKPAERCTACGEATGEIRADDAPAWATILLVGHLVSPMFFLFATTDANAAWLAFLAVVAAVLGLTALLLPRMKGLFIGLIWATKAGETAPD